MSDANNAVKSSLIARIRLRIPCIDLGWDLSFERGSTVETLTPIKVCALIERR